MASRSHFLLKAFPTDQSETVTIHGFRSFPDSGGIGTGLFQIRHESEGTIAGRCGGGGGGGGKDPEGNVISKKYPALGHRPDIQKSSFNFIYKLKIARGTNNTQLST